MFNDLTEDLPRWHRRIRPLFPRVEPLHLLLIGLVAFNPSVFPYLVNIANFCLQIITGTLHLLWAWSPWSFIAIGACVAGYMAWEAYHNMPARQYKPHTENSYIAARVLAEPDALQLGYNYLIEKEQTRQTLAETLAPPSEDQGSLTGDASSHLPVPSGHGL